jgi:hypothetical protein
MPASVNKSGNCPYCESSTYITTSKECRRPGQTVMQCAEATCLKWSVRQRGAQYPLQVPTSKCSMPTTKTLA